MGRWEEVGSSVVDIKGAKVAQMDFPDESRFPVRVDLIYIGHKAAVEGKSFTMEYSDDWRDQMTKRMQEFSALHGLRPERFTLEVTDRSGNALIDSAEAAAFPIKVAFVAEARTGAKGIGGRKRRRRKS